jgi:IS605 OrfB family transposase
MYITAAGMQASAVAVTENALVADEDELERVVEKLKTAKKRKRHGLSRRRQRLASRIERRKAKLAADDVRVVFGGRKLSRAGNDPVAAGFADRASWRAEWDRARSGTWFCAGDAEHSSGNFSAQIELASVHEATGDRLTLRIPKFLRQAVGGLKTITVPVRGFDFRRADLAWALEPDPASLAARSEEQQRARDEERKRHRTIVKRNSPVSVRISWNEQRQAWYVHATCQPRPATPARRCGMMLGVDVNPDHLAWCLVKGDGNPRRWGRVPLDLSGSSDQNTDRIAVAVKQLTAIAVEHGAAVACEKLDFSRARAGLRYLPAATARQLSSFAYNKILSILASRAQREGLHVVPVDPSYTSVLGQVNYAAVYGVSVDQGAACVIARRALGLKTRLRKAVRERIPVAEKQARGARRRPRAAASQHPKGTQAQWLRRTVKVLPRRRSTWDAAGLCARAARVNPFEGGPWLHASVRPAPRKQRRAPASAGQLRPARA